MHTIADVVQALEELAPPTYAESYDNPGLIVGDKQAKVTGVLVSLDCLESTVDEALEKGCNLVVSHHPIVFKGLKKLTGSNYVERTVLKAIRSGVALYASHTNLDSVVEGVSGRIASVLGLQDQKVLSPKSGLLSKLTVFVPKDEAASLRTALFAAGAGRIGAYADCSFNLDGTGTFTPQDEANPHIGERGRTEYAEESRVEVMLPRHKEGAVLHAMREAHPYEEVAYYLHHIANANQYVGLGMYGELPESMSLGDFFALVRKSFHLQVIRHTATDLSRSVQRVGLCGGAGSFLLPAARAAACDVFISGDFKYHEFFDAEGRIVIADIGHYESEQFTIDLLAEFLTKKFSTFATHLTEVNTNPVHYYY